MARQLNRNLTIAIVAVAVVIAIGLATGYFLVRRMAPHRYITKARALEAKGNYEQAAKAYAAAFKKTDQLSDRMAIQQQYLNALAHTHVKTLAQAISRVEELQAGWRDIAMSQPDNELARTQWLDLIYAQARSFDTIQLWDQLFRESARALQLDPHSASALKMRAISGVYRMASIEMKPDEIQQVQTIVQQARSANADDPTVAFVQAWAQVVLAKQARLAGLDTDADQRLAQAVKLAQQYLNQQQSKPTAGLINLVRILIGIQQFEPDPQRERLLQATVAQLAEQRPESVQLTLEAIGVVSKFMDQIATPASDRQVTTGVHVAAAMLAHAMQLHPDNQRLQQAMAVNLRRMGEYRKAVTLLEQVTTDRPYAVSSDIWEVQRRRAAAWMMLGETYIDLAEQQTDAKTQAALLAKADHVAQQLYLRYGSAPADEMLKGKIALSRDRIPEALRQFQKVNTQVKQTDPSALLLAARCLQRLGQDGEAATLLELALGRMQINQQTVGLINEVADYQLAFDNIENALGYANRALELAPNDSQAMLIKARAIGRQYELMTMARSSAAVERLQHGIHLAEQVRRQRPVEAGRIKANLQQIAGQLDQSQQTIRQVMDYLLGNPRTSLDTLAGVLEQAVAIAEARDDPGYAQMLVGLAQGRYPDALPLQIVAARLAGDRRRVEQLQQQMVNQLPDPLLRSLQLAERALTDNRIDAAVEHLNTASRLAPDDGRVLAMQFDIALLRRDWAEAEKAIQSAKQNNIDHANGLFWQGRLLTARGQFNQSLHVFRQATERWPWSSEGWRVAAESARLNGNLSMAQSWLEKSLQLDPDNLSAISDLYRLYRLNRQYTAAELLLRRSSMLSPVLLNTYVRFLAEHGEAERALQLRLLLAARRPIDQANRRDLAGLYLMNNQPTKAQQVLEELVQEYPTLVNTAALASLRAATGQVDDGIGILKQFIADQGKSVGMTDQLALARLLLRTGRFDQAMTVYQRAVALEDPKTMPASIEMANAYLSYNKLDQAAQLFKQIAEQTQSDSAWLAWIDTLVRLGRMHKAAEALQTLAGRMRPSMRLYLLQSVVAEARGETHDANRLLQEAVAMAPTSPLPYLIRARLRFDDPNPSTRHQVRADLMQAMALSPTDSQARQLLVRWYIRQNDHDQAVQLMQQQVEYHSHSLPDRLLLADMLLRLRQLSALRQLIGQSMQQMPAARSLWHGWYARIYQAEQKPAEALDQWRLAFEADPTPLGLADYMVALLANRRFDQVLSLAQRHTDLVDRNPLLMALQARAMAATDQSVEARTLFEKALTRAGDNPGALDMVAQQMRRALPASAARDLLNQAGSAATAELRQMISAELYMADGQWAQAQQILAPLAEQTGDPTNPIIGKCRLDLADTLVELDKIDQAIDWYHKALKILPNDIAALNNLALVLAEHQNKPAEALALIQRARAQVNFMDNRYAEVLDSLGWIQWLAGEKIKGEETLKQSVRIKPMISNMLHLARLSIDQDEWAAGRQWLDRAKQLAETDATGRQVQKVQAVETIMAEKSSKPATPR